MKVKLTGIVEVEVEVETEIDDEEFYEWAQVEYMGHEDMREMIPKFLRDYSDFETEIWANAPGLEDGDVLTAEFIEAEVLDDEQGP